MLVNIYSAKIIGIKAVPVNVEINITLGVGIHLVGLADAAVKESLLRTVTALQALGYHVPGKKIWKSQPFGDLLPAKKQMQLFNIHYKNRLPYSREVFKNSHEESLFFVMIWNFFEMYSLLD